VWIAAVLAIALVAAPAPAQEAAAGKPPPAAGVLGLLPAPVTTHHKVDLGGRTITYAATAGTLPSLDAKGETTAELFYVAYVEDPPSSDRPLTFVFNGGPGAASAFLHLGAMGPRLVAFAETGAPLPPPPALSTTRTAGSTSATSSSSTRSAPATAGRPRRVRRRIAAFSA
jgi:carboxypeptidase C (cathepsin A)